LEVLALAYHWTYSAWTWVRRNQAWERHVGKNWSAATDGVLNAKLSQVWNIAIAMEAL
jgi:hypothetical protein